MLKRDKKEIEKHNINRIQDISNVHQDLKQDEGKLWYKSQLASIEDITNYSNQKYKIT